jgi:fructose-1,6-bisphosphatase II
MTTTQKVQLNNIERLIELDFVRATESAALNAFRWFGKGDPIAAHASAVDALRGALDATGVQATVVMGDGMNPQPCGIESGEIMGNGSETALEIELAIIPLDGIDLVGNGLPGAVCALVAANRLEDESCFPQLPCRYMNKMAFGPAVNAGPGKVHLNASVRDNLEIVATQLGKRVQHLNVAVLDRPRHQDLIAKIRKAGSSVLLIREGDLAACLAPCFPETGVDLYMGTGGGAEAMMGSVAIKCLGGDILARLAPVDEEEEKKAIEVLGEGALEKLYCAEDLSHGDNVVFCATAISDSPVLNGIKINGSLASTHSVVMRSRYRTIRYIKTDHDLSRKKIRLHSTNAETNL